MPRDDDRPVFLGEVLATRRQRNVSAIVLPRPLSMKVGASLAAGALIALGLFLWFGEYTNTVHVAGTIEPEAGAIRVVAPQFGRITGQHVRNGAQVQARQALFDLSAERAVDPRIDAALRARHEELEKRLALTIDRLTERAATLTNQQRMAKDEIAMRRAALALGDEQVSAASDNVSRYEKLLRERFVSKAQVATFKHTRNTEKAQRYVLATSLNAAIGTLDQLREDAAANDNALKLARSDARQQLAALEQETAEQDGRRAMRVAAPIEGSITAVAYKIGQSVPAGAPLATILPAGSKMQAVLQVPSALLPFMKPGQQVALRIDAFPYQKVGLQAGTVEIVDHSPINDGAPGAEPMYRVTVALPAQTVFMDGTENPLEAAMRLQAEVLGDRRRLIAWLFEPMIGAMQRRPH